MTGAEFQGPDEVLVTVARGAQLETGDEGLDRGFPLPFQPVGDPTTGLIGLVQSFPDRPLAAGIEDSAVDAEAADGEDRDGDEVGVVRDGDGFGQEVEAVSERNGTRNPLT